MVSEPYHIWQVITVLLNYKYVYIWSTPPDFNKISGIEISTWNTVCTYLRCVQIHSGSTGQKDIIFPTAIVQFNNKHSHHNNKARSLLSEVTRIPICLYSLKKGTSELHFFLHLPSLVEYNSACLQEFSSVATMKGKRWQRGDKFQEW